ncbi:hypothetical protein HTV45_29375 [Streptomyces sp. CHD11]|uniref:DUF3592 domain-containing protein n=1 Tax=Streptomyces sp. CHD11 TaxID=2741325 RepID=UPI001BFC1ABD|nr:DUF3592 domain-containing protein [Streptomyces sp. CHD11]MBT3154935.1 hypothetical protein [Streptomyces sp. CHD11]
MDTEVVLLALCTGAGLGFLCLGVRAVVTAAGLWARGERVMGRVTARASGGGRRQGYVMFFDHHGLEYLLELGRLGPFYGVPPVGGHIPVVYARRRPAQARLWTRRHLLAPSFGWFVCSVLVFGAGIRVSG